MATVTRVSRTATSTDVEMMGGNMKFFTVDYVATNASTGPVGAQQRAHEVIAVTCNLVAMGPMLDSNTQQTFAAEGDVVAATIQAAIRALGTIDGVALTGATVTDTKLGILTAAVVA